MSEEWYIESTCVALTMSDTEEATEMKQAGALSVEASTEMLALLGQSLELAARRDEQMTVLLQHLHTQPSRWTWRPGGTSS